jgi:hypothetical protein
VNVEETQGGGGDADADGGDDADDDDEKQEEEEAGPRRTGDDADEGDDDDDKEEEEDAGARRTGEVVGDVVTRRTVRTVPSSSETRQASDPTHTMRSCGNSSRSAVPSAGEVILYLGACNGGVRRGSGAQRGGTKQPH